MDDADGGEREMRRNMNEITHCLVQAKWDGEADQWVATSEDVPGLVTASGSIAELADRLRLIIPALWPHTRPNDRMPERFIIIFDPVTGKLTPAE